MSDKEMTLYLRLWRQSSRGARGELEDHELKKVSPDSSFLEMLDMLNEQLVEEGKIPFEFDSDCREGICGTCSLVINGQPHGPELGTATCQLHMRSFNDGDTIVIEPWRAHSFPVIRDMVVDRSSLDRIIAAGGYTGAKTGPHADANAILVSKKNADKAMDAAACIGCGACVAACPNASSSLFTAAKISQLALLPQGAPMSSGRVRRMVEQMDAEGFGHCTNIGECTDACPKSISLEHIARMKSEYLKTMICPGS